MTSQQRARKKYNDNLTREQKLDAILRRYKNFSLKLYKEMLEAQKGVCLICAEPPNENDRLVVDHCHVTKMVRGLLCRKCNSGIGMFEDRYNLLVKATEYIKEFNDDNFSYLNKL